jgi:hypothetical protein
MAMKIKDIPALKDEAALRFVREANKALLNAHCARMQERCGVSSRCAYFCLVAFYESYFVKICSDDYFWGNLSGAKLKAISWPSFH